jgi:hypothetical protein
VSQNYIPQLVFRGKPYITVSPRGISNGLSDTFNDGADFGPDTLFGAVAPNQYGPPFSNTSGIQEAINYIATLGGGKVYLKRGTYTANTTIVVPSNIELAGEGRFLTIIQPSSTFTPNSYLSSINRNTLIWLSSSQTTDATVQNTSIHDLEINIPLSQMGSINGIYSHVNWKYVEIYNMYMVNASCWNEVMAPDSHHVAIRDFITINSGAPVAFYLNAGAMGQSYHDILVENIFNYINQSVGDDRVTIIGNSVGLNGTSNYNQVHNIIVRNIFVYVDPSVTSGVVNGVKIDTGINTLMTDILIDGVTFWGNASGGVSCTPFLVYINSYGQYDRLIIRNISAYNTNGIYIRHNVGSIFGYNTGWTIIDGVEMNDVYGNGGIIIDTASVPQPFDYILIKDFVIELASPTNSTNGTPVGIMLTGGVSAQGTYRVDIKDGIVINGYTAVSNNVSVNGGIQSTPYSYNYINVENVHAQSTGFSIANVPGTSLVSIKPALDNIPSISTPAVPSSGTALQNTTPYSVTVYLSGGSATQVQVTKGGNTYTVWSSSTATAIPSLAVRLNPGDSIKITYSTAPSWTWVPT